EDPGKLARRVFHLSRRLRQRLEPRVSEEERRKRCRKASEAASEERAVVGEMDGGEAGQDEHGDRDAEQSAHRHLDTSEPPDAQGVDDEKKEETREREEGSLLLPEDSPRQSGQVLGEGDREV